MNKNRTQAGFVGVVWVVIVIVVLAGAGVGYWAVKRYTPSIIPENEDKFVEGEIIRIDLGARQVMIKMDNKELELAVFPEFTKVFDTNGNELTLGDLREGLTIKTGTFYQDDVDVFVVERLTIEDETAGWKTYTNVMWRHSVSYPPDYVVFTALKTGDAGLVFPTEDSAGVIIAKNDNKIFCCEPATLVIIPGINENMSLAQWVDKQRAKPNGGEIISTRNIKVSGYDAVELIGGGNLGTPYKLIGVDVSKGSLFFEITQNVQDPILEKILSTFDIQ